MTRSCEHLLEDLGETGAAQAPGAACRQVHVYEPAAARQPQRRVHLQQKRPESMFGGTAEHVRYMSN